MVNERVVEHIKMASKKNQLSLSLSDSQLTQLPPEIAELKSLNELSLSHNQLTQLSPEIAELKNLKTLYLSGNKLKQLPPEIIKIKNITTLHLPNNQLTQLPPEITELKSLETLSLSGNKITQLPVEIAELKNLKILSLSRNQLTQLPIEIAELKNLKTFYISSNQLTQLPIEITEFKDLKKLDLSHNLLTQLPPEISKLQDLTILDLSHNQLTQLPPEISKLKNLKTLDLSGNPLEMPPPEIASKGIEAIFTYLEQEKASEHNEAKLILVGNGDVGKTCLAYRLVHNIFMETEMTEGINVLKWNVSSPHSENNTIKLNIWDFGGQEIYHATHQFFLTKRSVYVLVWNARRTKDYDHIYYWLHTIEAFGEKSPVILVMSKMRENDDDLNLRDLRYKFPQIVGYLKVDSRDGEGIPKLEESICETAWDLPLMRVRWVKSWYNVRKNLEDLGKNWITYADFCKICNSEGLDNKNIEVLDGYLHDLGVILHFKENIELKDIVILKPEWVTGAFYKILSAYSVRRREGVLLHDELSQIWVRNLYPSEIDSKLLRLMNKFELAYELPDGKSHLVAELLSPEAPDFIWGDEENLHFYYCYDYFLPPGIITRLIVRMHQDLEKKENGMPLCWREGALLKLHDACALVEMKLDEKQIEIRIKGDNKRRALEIICYHLDHINASIKTIKFSKKIPCNCSESCPQRYFYEDLLKAEKANIKTVQCHKSYKERSISLLLDGYIKREERWKKFEDFSGNGPTFIISPTAYAHSETSPTIAVEQNTSVDTEVNVNLKVDLHLIQTDFDNLKEEVEHLDPKLERELDKIQDSLDEVTANSEKEKLAKPLNKLCRFLDKLDDANSEYHKLISETQKGMELAQKLGKDYNKCAQWLALPQIPDLFLGK
ncbi:hypothetical protein MSMTP_1667 [Methanosarcina sp. MTP4]|uniref:leucine-rich repeat domain-containing protein n=1 Tax=Methanosarcina sp. MTP4 TaxID=1434100 RepID=UPI0006156B01|nr:COR domain-containing protein [Methanosarcina sp. MTP4]AKB25136.1 hypothetical protein MSMTP_1667 [Methanosarcina sp. MTP4]